MSVREQIENDRRQQAQQDLTTLFMRVESYRGKYAAYPSPTNKLWLEEVRAAFHAALDMYCTLTGEDAEVISDYLFEGLAD